MAVQAVHIHKGCPKSLTPVTKHFLQSLLVNRMAGGHKTGNRPDRRDNKQHDLHD